VTEARAAAVNARIRLALGGLGVRKLRAAPRTAFYDPPTDVPEQPGTVIRTEPAKFYLDPFRLVRAPARVERVMYSSRDRLGQPIAVTGTVLTPTRPRTKRSDRGLVAFAVGTQGLGDQCAPSRQLASGREYESVFITGLLTRGFNVVVPDYQGLGMEGSHTYMSRQVQGQVVLDALRAAQDLDDPDIPKDGPTALLGYSQGGGAAAAAAELWHDYAPELDVIGAVCGAVPADLTLLPPVLDGSVYFAFLGYALAGLAADYRVDLLPLLNDRGNEIVAAMQSQCMFESLRRYAFTRSETLTRDGRSIGALLADEPFASIVAEQKIGNGRWPRMDTLVSHSRLDDVVPFECGRALAERWVRLGARVRLSTSYAPTHAGAAIASYGAAFAFLNRKFRGLPVRANTASYLHALVGNGLPD